MALVSMRQLLDHAAENSYGLPAFNVNGVKGKKFDGSQDDWGRVQTFLRG